MSVTNKMYKTNKTVGLTDVAFLMLHFSMLLASVAEKALKEIDLCHFVALVDGHHVVFILDRTLIDGSMLDHVSDVLGSRGAFVPALAFLAHGDGCCGGWCDFFCAR